MNYNSKKIISKKKLLNNIKIIKSKMQNNQKFCAMVKADAYGHCAKTICAILKGNVDYFGVANITEAMDIRSFDKDTKIIIVGITEDFELCIKNSISFTIESVLMCEKLANFIKNNSLKNRINIHIKINTGMNRLGISNFDDFKRIIEICLQNKINIEGVFTHFSTAYIDEEFTKKQEDLFQEYLKYLPKNISPIIHVGGSFVLEKLKYQYTMIRFGIYMYGYCCPYKNIEPIMNINTKIVKVCSVKKNDRIGYDNAYICKNISKYAVLPIGYGDGIPRKISNNFYVKYSGDLCKQVGNICMDMMMIDIGKIKNANVGEYVIVFDNANEYAKLADTSPYEILTNFSEFRGEVVVE